ncbi:MAG: penicillin-binding protein 2 [Flavobacteriaceae bacterium]|nr:penicillin-binding protein 2 [Flavobacteriaceae bacterium]
MKKKSIPFYVAVICVGIVFISRLFYLQVIDNEYNIPVLRGSTVKAIYEYPERGYIFDRNGVLMVANQPSYDLMVVPNEVKNIDTTEFCSLLKIDKDFFIKKIEKAKNYSRVKPSIFLKQISKEDFAYIQEKMYKFEGFRIQRRSLRKYVVPTGANLVGYISQVNDAILKKNPYYQMGELIGRAGVEKTYERILRGEKGVKYVQRDNLNREKGSYKDGKYDTIAVAGKDLTLTIDAKLQEYGEKLMSHKRGAIVAIEPSSGEILASVSAPTYDPNLMVGRERSKNFNKLYLDSISKPLFDRGLQGEYPPGSPFKVVTALVGLQEGVITNGTYVHCHHGYQYGKRKKAFMKCHCETHGSPVYLKKAIYRSCNTYFATAYVKTIEKYETPTIGMNKWNEHLKSFGLGDYLHNDLSVGRPGFIPNGSYYDKWYPNVRWRATYNLSNAIGQGEVLTTPIQLANLTAIVANKGFYYTPHIVKKIKNQELDEKYKTPHHTSVESKYYDEVIEGLFQVVENPRGTAHWSKVQGIQICGKTGTAENSHGEDHSIFIAFAPKNNPKIAIAVFVENGSWGSKWAGPIATLMIEKYLEGNTQRKAVESRIMNGSIEEEYERQQKEILLEKLAKENEGE